MSLRLRIVATVIGLLVFILIGRLIKGGKLREAYAIVWGMVGLGFLLLAAWPEPFFLVATFLGGSEGTNALFLGGIVFCVLYNLHLSIKLTEANKKIDGIVRGVALSRHGESEQ